MAYQHADRVCNLLPSGLYRRLRPLTGSCSLEGELAGSVVQHYPPYRRSGIVSCLLRFTLPRRLLYSTMDSIFNCDKLVKLAYAKAGLTGFRNPSGFAL
jgi:hypothetical protein